MKIIFWGTPSYAVKSLKSLIDSDNNIIGVVTQPDRKRSRGNKLIPSPIKQTALEYDAACTPDFYLYNASMELIYRGQLDDSRPGNALSCDGDDLNNAIDCLIEKRINDRLQKPSIGCNIKSKTS